jgi:hypothetical protein
MLPVTSGTNPPVITILIPGDRFSCAVIAPATDRGTSKLLTTHCL